MSGSELLRLGVVGCGQVFERLHFHAIDRSHDFRLVSASEPNADRREWTSQVAPDVILFPDVETQLAQSALDALLVCTPPDTHAEIVLAALRGGLHVLAEKPLATSVAGCRAIVESARASDRRVVVGFNRRFRRTYRILRDRLAEGNEAQLRRLRFTFRADTRRWHRARAETDEESAAKTSGSEGILGDVASHQLDLVPWITGRMIEEVRARYGSEHIGRHAVTIEARLAGDVEAELHAGYGSRYEERLEVDRPDRTLVAYPATVIDPGQIGATLVGTRRVPAVVEKGMAWSTEAGRLLLRRLAGRPSLTVESIERQLTCFAGRIRGATTDAAGSAHSTSSTRWVADGADERDGLRCAAAVDACLRSLDAGSGWQAVEL